jgi:hypothetical protein
MTFILIQLLRCKCEVFSTLGDLEENIETETRLQQNLTDHGGLNPPKLSLVAPAALYLTALLNYALHYTMRYAQH